MSIFPGDLVEAAETLLAAARACCVRIVTAESCTGGLVAALLTEVAGSSDVVERGYVTYSNGSKASAIGVPPELIMVHGAVSKPVALAMARGALAAADAQLSVAITGVAGPGGGSPNKPVGLVHFATARLGEELQAHVESYGDLGRCEVRLAAVRTALGLLANRLQ